MKPRTSVQTFINKLMVNGKCSCSRIPRLLPQFCTQYLAYKEALKDELHMPYLLNLLDNQYSISILKYPSAILPA